MGKRKPLTPQSDPDKPFEDRPLEEQALILRDRAQAAEAAHARLADKVQNLEGRISLANNNIEALENLVATFIACLDPKVRDYLQRVSGKPGQEGLLRWLKYTGWDDEGSAQSPVPKRIEIARRMAALTKEPG
jgi:hypothetical protein